MTRVIVIPANGHPIRDHKVDIDPSSVSEMLKAMQSLVGGFVERVTLPALQRVISHSVNFTPLMLVDEDGRAHGRPVNPRATLLYVGREWEKGLTNSNIVGDAVLLGEHRVMGEDGPDIEWMGLPDSFTADYLRGRIDVIADSL